MNDLHPESENAVKAVSRQAAGKRIVFVSGNFIIVHPGHLRLLRFAAECGDFLVVAVNADRKKEFVVPEVLRLEAVQSNSFVDYGFILRDPPEAFIRALRPDIVVKGKEHEDRFNPEADAVAAYGGRLLFGSGDVRFSSIDLLRDEFNRLNYATVVKQLDFPLRHGFTMTDLKHAVGRFKTLSVLVIGDTIVDEYVICNPVGMSREDPTIVVSPVYQESFIGGGGIVAAHAAGLGASVRFFSVTGNDDSAMFARERFDELGMEATLHVDESRLTTRKQRFQVDGKTMLRVNHFREHMINREIQARMAREVSAVLDDVDLLIFADFNYGCLPRELVEKIISMGRRKGVMMVADSQSSSQVGDVSRFSGMHLLTPTEREARLSVKDYTSGLVVLAEALRTRARAGNVFITLGKEGLLIQAGVTGGDGFLTDRLPAMNTVPRDVAGAGDSMLTSASMALAVGCDIWQSAYLGSVAAACQVSRMGNTPLSDDEIVRELEAG